MLRPLVFGLYPSPQALSPKGFAYYRQALSRRAPTHNRRTISVGASVKPRSHRRGDFLRDGPLPISHVSQRNLRPGLLRPHRLGPRPSRSMEPPRRRRRPRASPLARPLASRPCLSLHAHRFVTPPYTSRLRLRRCDSSRPHRRAPYRPPLGAVHHRGVLPTSSVGWLCRFV